MYRTPCSVVGEALEPISGICEVSTRSRAATMVSELATPDSAVTCSCLISRSTAALPDSGVSPSSAVIRLTLRPPRRLPLMLRYSSKPLLSSSPITL